MIRSLRLRHMSVLGIFALLGATVGCQGDGSQDGDAKAGSEGAKAESGSAGTESHGGRGERGRGAGRRGPGGPGGPPGGFGGPGGDQDGASRGVPVEVETVGRRSIAQYFETHGTLEAENEVDLVARVAGPVVELAAEEGQPVRKGQLLARIDDRELVAQLEVARIRLDESEQSYERIKSLFERELVSRDAYDQSFAAYGSAKGDYERLQVQLEHTRITAPFSGLIVQRYVKFAEHLQNGAQLFRVSDFDPLLCPIQVPERELARLKVGRRAEMTVESFPEERFEAEILRISPVVDSASGTVKVTLQVKGKGKLRPGMFASVFLEMANRPNALVVPKAALALDSLGNTIFVAKGDTAERRDLEIGFRNDELLEVLSGVEEGETVVIVGQDGLSDGTPIEILATTGASDGPSGAGAETEASGRPDAGRPDAGRHDFRGPGGRGEGGPGGRRGGFPPIDWNDPEQVEKVKERMRERGLSDDQIDERLERMRERMEQGGGPGGRPDAGRPDAGRPDAGHPARGEGGDGRP